LKATYLDLNSPTLKVKRVFKSFDGFTAVDDLNLEVRPGRIFGLLGPNGAGKTTTIRMIVNITAPDSGVIELFGEPVNGNMQDQIGYLPEERGLYKRMRIGEQLRFFGELKSLNGTDLTRRIDHWLERVKLTEWKNKKATELSKGMQQKVQFVAAVMHDPELIILDEPFSGLDPINVELLTQLILELKAARRTIILSTHQMEIAERVCDDICLMNKSKKVLDGAIRDVKSSFARNLISMRFRGGEEVLDDRSIVLDVIRHSDHIEVLVRDLDASQLLLHKLIDAGAEISKFELVEPSLKEIFIAGVGQSND
jgi:ABC-2 type transport system ATP-binding protein